MKLKLDHIGIAVKDLDESLDNWQRLFEFKKRGVERIEERGVQVAQLVLITAPLSN